MVFHKLIVFRSNILKLEAVYLNAAELLQICEQLRCSNFALRFFALSMYSPNLVTLPNFNLRKREELLKKTQHWREGKREQAWKLKKKGSRSGIHNKLSTSIPLKLSLYV